MSRSQLQESEAAAVPDKAMLATVLSYLKNKNLKETAEVLQKELFTQSGDSTRPMQFSSGGQSGTEPMKYEESYTSPAPFVSTPTTPTAAYLKLANGNAKTATTTSLQKASKQPIFAVPSLLKVLSSPTATSPVMTQNIDNSDQDVIMIEANHTTTNNQEDGEDRDDASRNGGVASPGRHDNVTSTSSTPPPPPPAVSSPVKTPVKFQPVPFFLPSTTTNAAVATTKTLDRNPLWLPSKNVSPSSSSIGIGAKGHHHHQSIFFPSSISNAATAPLGLAGVIGGGVDVEGSGLLLKSPPTTIIPPPTSSVIGGGSTAIRPPPSLMYQLMTTTTTPPSGMPHPFLGGANAAAAAATGGAAVLTVLPSPPTTTLTVNPQSVFLVANQNLAAAATAGNPLHIGGNPLHVGGKTLEEELEPPPTKLHRRISSEEKSVHATSMEPATGQAQYPSLVSSTTTTTALSSPPPPPHPRTLASIPPTELTPQHLELKAFAEDFKTRRIRLGFTQGAVGTSLAEKGYNNFAQSTISRFEQMQLSPANAATIRVILEKWLLEAESPDTAPSNQSGDLPPMMAGRKRKKRAVFTPQTKSTLDEFFAQNPRPNRQAIEGISQKLDLLPEEVRVWFCNKRQKSKSGSLSSTPYDHESTSSATSSGVPSPTLSEGGMSQKRRSPSPPKTPFTIEELSKSSSNGGSGLIASPVHLSTSSLLPLGGLVASVTQSMNQPLIFASQNATTSGRNPAPPVIFRGGATVGGASSTMMGGLKSPPMLLPSHFLSSSPTQIIAATTTDSSFN